MTAVGQLDEPRTVERVGDAPYHLDRDEVVVAVEDERRDVEPLERRDEVVVVSNQVSSYSSSSIAVNRKDSFGREG